MNLDFRFDGFLSHSSKDKAVVRPLAERLRADGLKCGSMNGCSSLATASWRRSRRAGALAHKLTYQPEA